MGAVEANISISVDGFVAGPDAHGGDLGKGGEQLHFWLDEAKGKRIIDDALETAGAVITSRKVYEGTDGWDEDGYYHMPVFVLTHRQHDRVVKGETVFTFVTDGIEAAIAQAEAAAGKKKVHVMGGASVIQQALQVGLVDELHLHIALVLLGAGISLFGHLRDQIQLKRMDVVESASATHIGFSVLKG